MVWFDRLFPALMLLWPALLASCVRPHPTLSAPDAQRPLRRLWRVTLLALAGFAAAQTALELTHEQRTGLRAGFGVGVACAGSMLLFFRFAMPALVARSPGWGGPGARPAVRAASLRARDHEPLLPAWAWVSGWTLCAASALAIAWAVLHGVHPALLLGLGFWLGMGVGARAAGREPEPLDARGSPQLQAAYRAGRRARAWGFWCLGVTGTLAFAASAVLAVYRPLSAALLGSVAGCAIGLAGALFGTLASLQRARVNNALREIEAAGDTPPRG